MKMRKITYKGNQTIKELRKLEDNLQSRLLAKRAEKKQIGKEIHELQNGLSKLKNKIKAAQPRDLEVTDHAVLRYLERFMAIPVEEIKAKIKDEATEILGDFANSGRFPFKDGGKFVVENKVIVTVID